MNKAIIILLATAGIAFGQDRDLAGYTLVFEDQFDTLSIDTHRDKGDATWGDWPPYGPEGAFSFSHWAEVDRVGTDWHTVSGGILQLHMTYNPDLPDPNRKWISGLISSKDVQNNGFSQRFGYWSARIKMPQADQGAWCAFWLGDAAGVENRDNNKGYEIDIVEWYGAHANPDVYGWAVHPWNQDGSQGDSEGGALVNIPGGDAVNTWHVYGAEVNPEHIILYIDGQEVGRRPMEPEYLSELYILCNYGLRDDHSGQPYSSNGSSFMQVDWIRAYSLPDILPPTGLRVQ